MAILAGKNTRLLVQGMGRMGQFHAKLSREYGTAGGRRRARRARAAPRSTGMPVFDTVREAVRETGANASVVFVPPPGAADAILEAADAGIALVCCITEGIPALDMAAREASAARLRRRGSSARTARAS